MLKGLPFFGAAAKLAPRRYRQPYEGNGSDGISGQHERSVGVFDPIRHGVSIGCFSRPEKREKNHINPAEPPVDQHPKDRFVNAIRQNHSGDGTVTDAVFDKGRSECADTMFNNDGHSFFLYVCLLTV
jgi:hypothetical protein